MNLKKIRIKRGFSIPQLAELSGVHRRTIQDIEKSGVCKTDTATRLAHALGVDLDQLLGYQPYTGPYWNTDWKEVKLFLKNYLSTDDFQKLLSDDQTLQGQIHINAMNQAYQLYEDLMESKISKSECHWKPINPSY